MASARAIFLDDPLGSQRPQRLQQLIADLRHQPNRRRHGDIGDDVRGVLEPQPVLDQPQPTGLTHQVVENLLQALRSQPLAKIGQQGMVGQRAFQTNPQEQAERQC